MREMPSLQRIPRASGRALSLALPPSPDGLRCRRWGCSWPTPRPALVSRGCAPRQQQPAPYSCFHPNNAHHTAGGGLERLGLGAAQIPPLPVPQAASKSKRGRGKGTQYPARAVAWAIFACAVAAARLVPDVPVALIEGEDGVIASKGAAATISSLFSPWWLLAVLTFCNAVATTISSGGTAAKKAVAAADASVLRLSKAIHAAVSSSSLEATASAGGKADKAKALRSLRLAGSSAPSDMPGSAAVGVAAASVASALEALPIGVDVAATGAGDGEDDAKGASARTTATKDENSQGGLRPGFSLKAIPSTGFGEHESSRDKAASSSSDVPPMSWSPSGESRSKGVSEKRKSARLMSSPPRATEGTGIVLRTRGYATTRIKERSRPGLYQCLSVDYTCPPPGSQDFLSHIARTFSALGGSGALDFTAEAKAQGLESVGAGGGDAEAIRELSQREEGGGEKIGEKQPTLNHTELPLPRLLCVNLIVHTVAPSMWGESAPDPGRNIVLWFHMSAECIESFIERGGAASDGSDEASAASNLFAKFYGMAFDDEDVHAKSTEEAGGFHRLAWSCF